MSKLRKMKNNPNKGTKGNEYIARSLQELGAARSIVATADGEVIAGNHVLEQAEKLGIPTRVVQTDGSELVVVQRTDVQSGSDKAMAIAVADNKATEINLEWDEEQLSIMADDVGSWTNIDNITPAHNTSAEVKEDDFDPDAHYETKVKAGEVWQLGEHRLMCGDSTDADAVARLMNGEQADLWLTDPPYNVDYSSKNDYLNKVDKGCLVQTAIANDKMSDDEFMAFLCKAFGAAQSVMKEGASFYVWTAQGHALTDISKALDANGLYFRQQLIWVKNNLVLGRSDYQGKHEPCFYGWKAGAAHHWYSDRSQTTILEFDKPQKSDLHPTMKPVPLFGYQVGNSTKEGDIVIDTFGGSGTTMIACEQLGRKCRMMELDPHYCTVIIARWEKLTGKKALLL